MIDTGTSESGDPIGPEQGGGPPLVMPWTLVVEGDGGWSADLEHGAPLPRIGDHVDYIADDGTQHRFQVRDVIHTVQSSSGERPRVRDEHGSPNSTVEGAGDRHPGTLRAGLPQVVVSKD